MNTRELDVLINLYRYPFSTQRELAEKAGHSLGVVNRTLHNLVQTGYLEENYQLTEKARADIKKQSPRKAIILAAGFGMRMVPINLAAPKALLEVHGEVLIERMIRQLHEAGISDITIVVGYMKESFEYLIDKFGVKLVVNPEYSKKNNLISLALVADRVSNCYIIPSDVWCAKNPFRQEELYSWYMISDQADSDSPVRINRKMELVKAAENAVGNKMIGIAYICKQDASYLRDRILYLAQSGEHDEDFWEIVLYEKNKVILPGRLVSEKDVVEINTYEQLRELDGESVYLKSDALDTIAEVFGITTDKIVDIQVLKKGMTNRSFLFSVNHQKYIMRIPGEGTNQLINRQQEAEVFRTISGRGICDDPIYINPEQGYKITKYLNGVRVCDANCEEDVAKCMKKLRCFHEMRLTVPHVFDIFEQIGFYESLWNGHPSAYRDYRTTKEKVLSLKAYIDSQNKDWCLTHIDAVPDNFLFYRNQGEEQLQLTDWEYSGMQDPHVDIAMFGIYALYDKEQMDHLIDLYFPEGCERNVRLKIYCYIAACGLLWSNWCEYKSLLGVEFGEYSLRQYRYAKDFFRYAQEMLLPKETKQ